MVEATARSELDFSLLQELSYALHNPVACRQFFLFDDHTRQLLREGLVEAGKVGLDREEIFNVAGDRILTQSLQITKLRSIEYGLLLHQLLMDKAFKLLILPSTVIQ